MAKLRGIVTLTRPYVLVTTLSFFVTSAFLSVNTIPPLLPFFIGFIATGLAIASAHILNDYADREADKANPRTVKRPIPSGLVPARQALIVGLGFGLSALILTIFLNPFCTILALFGAPLPFLYNYLRKRSLPISFICTVLAVIFIILFGSTSASGQFSSNFVWLFVIFGMSWEMGRTFASEVQDVDTDTISNVMTLSVSISSKRAAQLIFGSFTTAVVVSLLIGFFGQLGFIYLIPTLAVAIWLIYRTLELVRAPTTPNAVKTKIRASKYLIVISITLSGATLVNSLLLGI
ncbi:MAG: UbiA prenyltransferase family protein [Candidatus Hodarchaeota archaeon]